MRPRSSRRQQERSEPPTNPSGTLRVVTIYPASGLRMASAPRSSRLGQALSGRPALPKETASAGRPDTSGDKARYRSFGHQTPSGRGPTEQDKQSDTSKGTPLLL